MADWSRWHVLKGAPDGSVTFEKQPWGPGFHSRISKYPSLGVPQAWLNDAHTDAEWLAATHRTRYSNRVCRSAGASRERILYVGWLPLLATLQSAEEEPSPHGSSRRRARPLEFQCARLQPSAAMPPVPFLSRLPRISVLMFAGRRKRLAFRAQRGSPNLTASPVFCPLYSLDGPPGRRVSSTVRIKELFHDSLNQSAEPHQPADRRTQSAPVPSRST